MKDIPNSSKEGQKTLWARWSVISILIGIFIAGLVIGLLLKSGGGPGETTVSISTPDSKILFWTCSMHPNIQKQKPGKCPICGMDLIPVTSATRSKEMGGMRQIVISDAARAMMNIQTTPVERRYVTAEVRMVGKVDYDETRLGYITAWISGRLDRLYVDYTGVEVKKRDHMVSIYSPELYSTQDELIQVLKRTRKQEGVTSVFPDVADLIEPVRERLRLWGMTKEQIQEIEKSEKPSDHLTIYSPMGGIVIQKNRQEGDYVNVGDRIYTVADLSYVWVMLDAYESDLVWLRYGQEITFTTEAYPGEKFVGRIAFIEPVLNAKTRTVKVRVNVPNLSGKLKPEMFVHGIVYTQISTGGKVIDPHLVGKWICPMHPEIIKDELGECDSCGMPLVLAESLGYVAVDADDKSKPLVIPVTAALVTGTRAIVYVELPDTDEPTFEGREIVLGPRAGDYYLVRSGLKEGEIVVTNGNFKIDSAIQIQAKPSMMTPEGGGGGGHQHGEGKKPSKAGQGKTMAPNSVPAEFHSQLQKLESAYDAIATAVKLEDLSLVRNEFQVFGEALSKVDGGLLSGHLRMLWKERSMLLNNDAVEGRDVKKFTEIDRVFKLLTKNMRRVRERFGTSHDTQRPQLSQRLEVSADFHSQLVKLWEAYLSLQQALASDNLLLAQQAVTHFQISLSEVEAKPLAEDAHQIWKKEYSKFTQILQNMDQAENLKSIRKNFSLLSDELLVLVRSFGTNGFRTVYQMHCPMVFDGKGAMWLQDDKQVSNPYFGQVMLKCGDRIELISDGKMREHKGERHHAQHLDVSADFHLQLVKLWESYLSLQQALASDNLLPAQQAVTQFQTSLSEVDAKTLVEDAHEAWKKEYSKFTQILQNMNQAEDLESIREDFSILSDELMELIKTFDPDGFGTVYQMHCPMVFDGKGAMWLQKEKHVRNPYFGTAMLKCADKVELISSEKDEEHKGGAS
jgi:Cu(I)/Ag(I) efflux system membrane fusion protein